MVAMTLDWASAPVATAQVAVRNNGSVSDTLASASVPASAPCASSPTAVPGQWARYVGMVQDIWDAELFVASSATAGSGLLVEDCAASTASDVTLSERLPVYLVSLPGATSWTRPPRTTTPASEAGPQRPKRAREEDIGMSSPSPAPGAAAAPSSAPTPARPPRVPSAAADAAGKRQRPGPSFDGREAPFLGLGLNLPHNGAGGGGSAVLAKIYDNCAALNLKVNSVVEVIGVLQRPLRVSRSGLDGEDAHEEAFVEEAIARNPMNVPRLHAVRVRVLEPWEVNPAVAAAVRARGMPSVHAELATVLPAMRELLVKFLASALYGDALAAEYLLMALVSRPAARTSAGGTLGKLSLNLIFPADAGSENTAGTARDADYLTRALQALLPSVVTVGVSIAALNARDLYPRKDYVANRLRAAPLQLPPGSLLLADETALSNGQLAERGVKNVRALEAVAARCVVPADFQFYNADLPTHNCSVFLSRGGRSIVSTDVQVRVRPNLDAGFTSWESCDENMLAKLRLALGVLVEGGNFAIPEQVTTAVENHFVEARKAGKAKDGQEVLTRWLSVARTAARTFGESELTTERWAYAMRLEERREEGMRKKNGTTQ